jgi:predicted enzyme related to lactoylglutathione lyase
MSNIPLGRLCWYELMTSDPGAAPEFYGQITGWATAPWQAEGADPYTMWMNGEKPVGGLMELPEEARAEGAPPHWLVYISTPDVDDTATRAEELGGAVLHRMEIPSVGKIAIIRDPQGAVFAAFQPDGDTPGHDGPPDVGEFSWNELATETWEGAWSFYSQLFGWKEADQMDMGDMGKYQMYSRGAHPLGGIFNRPPEIPVPGWLFYIRVPEIEAAVEKVKALGGTVINGPMEVPGGDKIAQCVDPQGATFAVHATAQA